MPKVRNASAHDPVPPGRTDATQEMTDVESIAYREPKHDGFRNYLDHELDRPAPENFVDRAQLLALSAPEMAVLGINTGQPGLGVLTRNRSALTNDFFVNLPSMDTQGKVSPKCEPFYEGTDRKAGEMKWLAGIERRKHKNESTPAVAIRISTECSKCLPGPTGFMVKAAATASRRRVECVCEVRLTFPGTPWAPGRPHCSSPAGRSSDCRAPAGCRDRFA